MSGRPTGTVTFLLTDVEGSTPLWQDAEAAMRIAAACHDALFEHAIQAHGGVHIRPRGEGDSRFAVFPSAPEAMDAALAIQQSFAAESWPTPRPVMVRIGVHTGEAELRDRDYYGSAVNRCARIRGLGHGGQTLLSEATAKLGQDALSETVLLQDLGEHRLRDLSRPERIFQVTMPGLSGDFPPLASLDVYRHNFPIQPNLLIGRQHEIEAVSGRLARDDVRLLTLTGPGGTGKTRLALQVAADLIHRFDDGVVFVALAPVRDSALVASTIGQALGVRHSGGQPILESLLAYLRQRRLLLLLDNFEQILPAATVVGELLSASPGLKVLVTSRAPLHLRGEHEFPVPPLALPSPTDRVRAENVAVSPSVALFVQRAADIRPDFTLTEEIAAPVAEICRRLDGLPLALELAAARIKVLNPQAMLTRLERRLPLLTGGARDLPERQRTLRDTIAWSYELLDKAEQRLFRALSVFIGGSTLEAIEAVHARGNALDTDVLDVVASLVDKSLVRQIDGPDHELRFTMLETIREYGLEQLAASGEESEIRRRHAEHFRAWVEAAEPELHGPDQAIWLDRVRADHDNVRAALTWALGDGAAPEVALRLTTALAWFWFIRGHLADVDRLEAAIAATATLTGDTELVRTRAKALYLFAWLGRAWNDPARNVVLSEESVALFHSIGDHPGMARSLTALGLHLRDAGDYARARVVAEEGLALAREVGDRAQIGQTLYVLASILFYVHYAGKGATPTIVSPGSPERPDLSQSEPPASRARFADDYALVICLLEESVAIFRQLDDAWGLTAPLTGGGGLSEWSWANGDYARATLAAGEALQIRRRLGEVRGICETLSSFAIIALGQQRSKRAARLAAAAYHFSQSGGARRLLRQWRTREQEHVAIRAQMRDDDFSAAWAEGMAMSLEEAIDYALQTGDGPTDVAEAFEPPKSRPCSPLTPREQEVAILVGRGYTNRRIAEELVIAEKTAEVHARNVREKLGLGTRAQIAAWVAQQGLLDADG